MHQQPLATSCNQTSSNHVKHGPITSQIISPFQLDIILFLLHILNKNNTKTSVIIHKNNVI
jgi:hypothetical protein